MDADDETPDLSGEVQILSHRSVFVGPYSTVYRGKLKTDNQLVAIKVLNPINGIPMNTIQRKVNRERWTWSRLHHPNILPLYGFADGEELFEPFGAFISPWCARGDMAQYLREHGPQAPLDERMNLWKGVVAGVEYLHRHTPTIVHGDLKPGNILINDAGNAQICDFGLVKIFLEQGSTGMTTTTVHTGTERYLAYELVMGEESNPTMASDIYAVGCIGLELLFFEVPYSNRGHGLRWHLLDDMRSGIPPGSCPEDLSDEEQAVWTLVLACWARTPSSRPSATSLLASLENTSKDASILGPQGPEDHIQSTMMNLQLEGVEEAEGSNRSMSNQPFAVTHAHNGQGHEEISAIDFRNTPHSRSQQELPAYEGQKENPQTLQVSKDPSETAETTILGTDQKVELRKYSANLVYKPGEYTDMDLLDDTRSLIYSGKLLREVETRLGLTRGWSELFVLLFDNYLVMTEVKEQDGVAKYHIYRYPIPLELLGLLSFTDPPSQRRPRSQSVLSAPSDISTGVTGMETKEPDKNDRYAFPLQFHQNGRRGGVQTLFAESAQSRLEWKVRLEEAIALRSSVQASDKIFEFKTLSIDTFIAPEHDTRDEEGMFAAKVTCSVPFTTSDGRKLVAIGSTEGVWIGLRNDSKSMRRVLYVKHVTQCAMLEDSGLFLVLAEGTLFAYQIEALVPTSPPSRDVARNAQKVNGNKDIEFFTTGMLGGRTLIIYMKRKGTDSVFRVLEPVIERINEKEKASGGFGRFTFGNSRSEWFRIYRDFFLPSEAFDIYFLKAKLAILCTTGFEIMDLMDFKSVTIPQRDDRRLAPWKDRLQSCKPLGMFRSSEDDFLLCYNEFGMYVDRHGDPSSQNVVVGWEGTAQRVACHPPYIVLFDPRFIEIRLIQTGRLVQIISGDDVRCLWDGRGGGGSVPMIPPPGPDGWEKGGTQHARIHAMMRAEEPGRNMHGVQHVFELSSI